ncbi:uncharacterized protein Dvir_GJ26157, partial [Drosophila virilis]
INPNCYKELLQKKKNKKRITQKQSKTKQIEWLSGILFKLISFIPFHLKVVRSNISVSLRTAKCWALILGRFNKRKRCLITVRSL